MKRLYLVTMLLFVLSSALCGLAWDLPSLILFRVLQGLGGGMLQPLGMAIVFSIVTPRERPRFMALLGLPMLVAPLLGPTLGGFLVEYVDWHTVFTVNIPVGMVGLVLAWLLLKETPARHDAPLDKPGFVLSTIAFPALLLGFTFGSREGWESTMVQIYLSVGVVSFVGWIYAELTQDEPMLDLRLFQTPIFAVAMGMNFVAQILLFGMQLLLPIYLQAAQGLTALQAGLVLVPQGIASFVSMNISGRLYYRFGPRPLVFFGLGMLTLTSWEMAQVTLDTPVLWITVLAMARGFSMGFCMMPVQTAAYNTVPQPKIARATALSNGLMRIFGSFSTAFLATVLNSRTTLHYAQMAATLSLERLPVGAFVDQMRGELALRGVVTQAAQDRVITGMLSSEVNRQALGMAFSDTLMVMTLFGIAGFALAFFVHDPGFHEGPATAAARRGAHAPAAPGPPSAAMPAPAGGPAPSHSEP
jgi:EmrB/QacA subfamily drug resistance transporter